MQGIILNTFSVKDKDLIVFILSEKELYKVYRFYGVRHSHLLVGNYIDYELNIQPLFLPKLHSTMQIALPWQNDMQIFNAWQNWCLLLFNHLKDNSNCGEFYFALCLEIIEKLKIQDYKRVFINAYAKMLNYEGRLNINLICHECSSKIEKECGINDHFLPTCKFCNKKYLIQTHKFIDFLKFQNSSILDETEISMLYKIYSKGL